MVVPTLHDALLSCEEALRVVVFIPPFRYIFLAAVASLAIAGLVQRPFGKHLWRPYHWLVFTHVLFFVGTMAVGWLGAAKPDVRYRPDGAASLCMYGIEGASLLFCLIWIILMKGFRWFAASLMVMLEIPLLGAILVAGLAISGDSL